MWLLGRNGNPGGRSWEGTTLESGCRGDPIAEVGSIAEVRGQISEVKAADFSSAVRSGRFSLLQSDLSLLQLIFTFAI
jgi:hypothetical protein